jgi:hypothetical protein
MAMAAATGGYTGLPLPVATMVGTPVAMLLVGTTTMKTTMVGTRLAVGSIQLAVLVAITAETMGPRLAAPRLIHPRLVCPPLAQPRLARPAGLER